MHVRITNKGRRILNDRALASKVVNEIIRHHEKLSDGESIKVGEKWSVKLVTSIKEEDSQRCVKKDEAK